MRAKLRLAQASVCIHVAGTCRYYSLNALISNRTSLREGWEIRPLGMRVNVQCSNTYDTMFVNKAYIHDSDAVNVSLT